MVWYFIGVYIISRTLHGHLEIHNFSSCVEEIFHSFAVLTHEIFFNNQREISYLFSERQCTILYVYIFFSYINITLSLNKAHRKSRTILQGNWKLWIKREGQEKIWLWAGSIYTFLQILSNTGMDRKGNIVFFFFKMVLNTGSYSHKQPNVSDYRTI